MKIHNLYLRRLKTVLLFFIMFFSAFSMAQSKPTCPTILFDTCQIPAYAPGTVTSCTNNSGYKVMDIANSGGECSAVKITCVLESTCTCPTGQKLGTVGTSTTCVPDNPLPPGQGGQPFPDDGSCPAPQKMDARGKCNLACKSPMVFNAITSNCEILNQCLYPKLYNVLSNSCSENPLTCAMGASRNALTGECWAVGATSCPSGFACKDSACLTCGAVDGANSSQGSNTSSGSNTSTGSNTSSGSGTSEGSNTSTGSNSSVTPPVKPPTTNDDNTDQNQSGGGSKPIPANTSFEGCRTQNTEKVCNDFQNCQLTFGAGRCVGMTEGQSCPNSYILNGQKYCILNSSPTGSNSSAGGSGSNSSAGTGGGGSNGSSGSGNGSSSGTQSSQGGECDPTSKSYDECMGRNATPSAEQTSKIKNDFIAESNKAVDDYSNVAKEDIETSAAMGVSFKDAPNSLKTSVLSFFPQYQTCIPIQIHFKLVGTITLSCELSEVWKRLFGWFLSCLTVLYIYKLAMRPIER